MFAVVLMVLVYKILASEFLMIMEIMTKHCGGGGQFI